ncbi:MAG: glycosyltransferase family 4 protein [Pseudomonadota bacterium]
MSGRHIAFAVPGDLTTLTGGYIYDRRVMHELRNLGWSVDHVELPDGFPNPTKAGMKDALCRLQGLPPGRPVIIDGLAFGALDPDDVAKLKIPIIALVHHPLAKENGLSTQKQKAFYLSERANLQNTVQIIVPSKHTCEILVSDYGVPYEKIVIAKPGIDRPTEASVEATPPLILSVGIQLPRKGHDVLLQALADVKDLNWQAIIAGAPLDPHYAQHLQDLQASLGLKDRVTLAGQVDRDTLGRLYCEASLFALATHYEGYGIVFDEALVHGLPIVSCDAGAVADTVPVGAGMLVPPNDPAQFANALCELLSDSERRKKCADISHSVGLTRPGWTETAKTIASAISNTCAERAL